MDSEVPAPNSPLSKHLRDLPAHPYRSQIPVLTGFLVALLVWGVTASTLDLGYSLLVLCALAVIWEVVVLLAQNHAVSRPSPERVEEHNWLRGRAIAWSIVVIALSGAVLTAGRLNGGISSALIPNNSFSLTEIVILALSIAILAVLTRYSAISSYVESSRTTAELGGVLGEVRDTLQLLKASIEGLSAEVGRLRTASAVHPRVQGSVFHISPDKSNHQIAWRVTAAEALAKDVKVTVTVDGTPRAEVGIGDVPAGAHKEGSVGRIAPRTQSGSVSLEISYSDSSGRRYTDSFDYAYTVLTGFWGGIKSVSVTRA